MFKCLVQEPRVEDVDAHTRQGLIRTPRHGGRIRRFFNKLGDHVVVVHGHHAKSRSLVARHGNTTHRAIAPLAHVISQHERVIHFVDVVPGEHQNVVNRAVAGDDVLVLVDSIGCTPVPAFVVSALLRWQQIDEFVHFAFQKSPATLQVTQQAVRFVLGDHANPADAGIQAVGEREIDNPEFAAKINSGFGAAVRQVHQSAAPAPRQHQRYGPFGQVKTKCQFIRFHVVSSHSEFIQGLHRC